MLSSFGKQFLTSIYNLFGKKETRPSEFVSSLGIKYPKLRDHPANTCDLWLENKRLDDGAEGLWRIHDDLYDLTNFVQYHPGGKEWLTMTKGTDVTEAFESFHISEEPAQLLNKYFKRKATVPRNSPFTFKDGDFYKVLKAEIRNTLKTVPKQPAVRSKYLTDGLFIGYITLALLAVYFKSFLIGTISGVMLALTAIAAHNFFHQKDNFRMYYFDFTMMESRVWRVSHALSHHLFPNTINDLEISMWEPFLHYLPTRKHFIFKYSSWLYSPMCYAGLFMGHFFKGMTEKIIVGKYFTWESILPFTVPVAMYILTNEPLTFCLKMFFWIIIVSSTYFGLVGLSAGHHDPETFHDGDAIRPKDQMDWGIFQLDAVIDRADITGSHFLVLTSFGDHALHHLFPTIDHGLLEYLYPTFLKTCKQFGLEWRVASQLDLIKGQYRQQVKSEPNNIPRGTKKDL